MPHFDPIELIGSLLVLSGHICRCTGYAGIMAALKEAVGIS